MTVNYLATHAYAYVFSLFVLPRLADIILL